MPFYIIILKRVLFWGKFHFGCSFLLIPHLNFISLTTKDELNLYIENDKMLESHKKRLSQDELIKPQEKMKHTFLTAVNKFQLRQKPLLQSILLTRRLSPSDGKVSPFWFISSRLPVSANNLPVFEIFSDAPHQNSPSQIFLNTPTCFLFCDCLFEKFPLKEVFYLTQNTVEYRK